MIDLYRHLGYYETAERLAQEEVSRSRDSLASSYDDRARADVNLAAALHGSHRFQQIEEVLGRRNALAHRLQPRPGSLLHQHYAGVFGALGLRPDHIAADAFLRRLPFF